MKTATFVLLGLTLASLTGDALAWGRDGHCLIADIAQSLLTPNALAGVTKVLGAEGSMADVANWADDQTHDPHDPWLAPLHFANIRDPVSACAEDKSRCRFNFTRDCVDREGQNPGSCNTGAVMNYTARLSELLPAFSKGANKSTANATREALKFVVHFVGDIHQPLHCGILADRGGVLINVLFPVNEQGEDWNLHNVWDFGLLVNREGKEGNRAELLGSISARIKGPWSTNATVWAEDKDPNAWVQESLDAATEFAYRFANGTVVRRTEGREDHVVVGGGMDAYMAPGGVVEGRIATAGVRLAATLNEIFASAQR